MGLIADIAEVMEELKEGRERATPETVIALAVRKERGETDDSGYGQEQGFETA